MLVKKGGGAKRCKLRAGVGVAAAYRNGTCNRLKVLLPVFISRGGGRFSFPYLLVHMDGIYSRETVRESGFFAFIPRTTTNVEGWISSSSRLEY